MAGLAFIVGPALGGLLFHLTSSLAAPMYLSAVIYLLNTVLGYAVMPESLIPERRTAIRFVQLNPLTQLVGVFRLAHLRLLLLAIFVWTIAFAIMQGGVTILTTDKLGWLPDANSAILTYIGVIGVVLQGGLMPGLLKRIPEGPLGVIGIFVMGIGFVVLALLAFAVSSAVVTSESMTVQSVVNSAPFVFIAATILAIGYGLTRPTTSAMVSKSVSPTEQGRASGGNQAVQALGRVLGPLLFAVTYGVNAAIPWAASAACVLVAGLLILGALPVLRAYRDRMGNPAGPVSASLETT